MGNENGQQSGPVVSKNQGSEQLSPLPAGTPGAAGSAAGGAANGAAGADRAARLYGRMPVALDELSDLIDELVVMPGSTIELSKEDPQQLGRYDIVGEIPLESWSIITLAERHGGGNYRFKLKPGDNPRHPRKCGFFRILPETNGAAKAPPPQQQQQQQLPQFPQFQQQQQQHAAPPGLDAGAMMAAALGMFTTTMQAQQAASAQQNTLLMTLLTKQMEAKPAEVSQLGELVRLAKSLSSSAGSDANDPLVEGIATVAAKVAERINAAPAASASRPIPPAAAAVIRARRASLTSGAQLENKAAPGTSTPAPGDLHQSPSDPAGMGMTPLPPGTGGDLTSSPSNNVPDDEATAKKRLDLVVQVIVGAADDADRDAVGLSGTIASLLGKDACDRILGAPDAILFAQLNMLYPELAPHQAWLSEVLKEFREEFSEDEHDDDAEKDEQGS